MSKKHIVGKGIVAICLFALTAVCQGKAPLNLQDALHAALEKQKKNDDLVKLELAEQSSEFNWLDGAPTVSMLYLHNQTQMGTKEAEITLSLPIKSSVRQQVENNLNNSDERVVLSARRQLALYYSGIIRNSIWEHATEKAKMLSASRKESVLQTLLTQYKRLAEANSVPQYTLYLLQKEFNDSRILLMQHERKMQMLLTRYKNITGLDTLPETIQESLPENPLYGLQNHPDIQALDSAWQAYTQTVLGASKSAEPWSVQLTARRIEAFNFNENQVGIGVDIPINAGQALSNTQRSEYLRAKVSYEVEREKRISELANTTKLSLSEHQFLVKKQNLLDASVATLDALEDAINTLLESNAQNQSVHIRNLLELIDAQEQVILNRIAVNQQVAIIKQSAGLTI